MTEYNKSAAFAVKDRALATTAVGLRALHAHPSGIRLGCLDYPILVGLQHGAQDWIDLD